MTTICRHIKLNGERCGSPALRDQAFCYFHRTLANRHPKPPARDLTPTIIHPRDPTRELQLAAVTQPVLDLPPLEDRESIQLAASIIVGALARNTLDPARAGTLLYGLLVASTIAARLAREPSRGHIVTETILTPNGDELAPDEDPQEEMSPMQKLLADLLEQDDKFNAETCTIAGSIGNAVSAAATGGCP
jgi:hypothetical protein